MRWLTTKSMFSLWCALMHADVADRKLFLQLLYPIVISMSDKVKDDFAQRARKCQ